MNFIQKNMVKSITSEQLVKNLIQGPDNEYEYRIHINGILYSTRWLTYDSKTQKIGESFNWFHYDYWYSISEFIETYSCRRWVRDR